MKTQILFSQNNSKLLENIVKDIKQMPDFEIETENAFALIHHKDFQEPIIELSENQKSNFKNLIKNV